MFSSWTFSAAITPVFRNHSNMLICCSRNISYYYSYQSYLNAIRWRCTWPLRFVVPWYFYCFCLFLLLVPVLSNVFPISFTRNELLDIRNSTPDNLLPTFEHSDFLLDILVGGAAFLYKRSRRRKRGKRAGALVKSRQGGFRILLLSIHLVNLRSLANKSDELQLLTCTNKDFLNSAALCFTETWLNGAIPDSALHLAGFQLFRADRVTESSGKTRGGGLSFYINEDWCTDVTVLKKMCCPNLEALFINCKPFYSPQEFSSFILVCEHSSWRACERGARTVGRPNHTHRAALPGLFHYHSRWF